LQKGLPTGSDRFKRQIEQALSIKLSDGKRDRPKKANVPIKMYPALLSVYHLAEQYKFASFSIPAISGKIAFMVSILKKFLAELSRRNVIRIAALYGVSAWATLSIADIIIGILDFPDHALRFIFFALLLGFPVVVVLSWIYEWTPDGLKKEIEISPGDSITAKTGRNLNVLTGASVGLVLIGMALQYFIFPATDPDAELKPPANSVAVLPFVDMSPEGDQEYFADGIAEELLNLLAKIPKLQVAARTSAFAFKGKNEDMASIAKKLRVAYVLEGSVRKAGQDVRITAQLIEADKGYHLFSETYDRSMHNIFAVQDNIAAAVVDQLKITLLDDTVPRARQTDPEVFNLYLKGKGLAALFTDVGIEQAISTLTAALEIDPEYAPAWAELGLAYVAMAKFETKEETWDKAHNALERALAIDENNPEAWAALVDDASTHWDFAKARNYLQKALALAGDNALVLRRAGSYESYWGDREESIALYLRALQIDPLSLALHFNLGLVYWQGNQTEKSLEYLDQALVLRPGLPVAQYYRGAAILQSGDAATALTVFQAHPDEARALMGSAMAFYDLGQELESAAAADAMEEKFLPEEWHTHLAEVRAYRGEIDQAFELLDIAFERRQPSILTIQVNPHFAKLHPDLRWAALIEKINTAAGLEPGPKN
jgi:adenylate cyclase